ncbi:dynamin [Reticulibacter mediterranei]|uniref:Dynamin n=1 Tax=Reticulibacter mediterranei TaxID=2778369 RepID=A0A8J3N2I2_9CHLR|nr:dynamin family protein [Reticulibacter mediterranei]GHO92267.1 dynamin [Reticulibacter mediterranei]
MAKVVLQERQHQLLQRERRLAQELQACFTGFEETNANTTMLQQVVASLDDLFLLVVVGEFNAGKSAFINTLLRQDVLEEGVVPTTNQVTIIRYGEQHAKQQPEQGLLEYYHPADFLRDISIVDTPGMNAVLQEHEQLTRDFVPRSDLILFVTSVDRPFTQSERLFLEHIRAWGKKVVIILNKTDLLRNKADLRRVQHFVAENCKHLLGFEPEIIPISILLAQKSRTAIGHDAIELWEQSNFGTLEKYLFQTLDKIERVRLKFLSPLGVMQRLLDQTRSALEQRTRLLAEDARTVGTIDEQLQLYREDMEKNFSHRLSQIENIVLEMRARGDHFFDDTIRLTRILDLLHSERIRSEFEQEVLGDSATRIDQAVQELIDWLVEHEHRLWQDVMEYLDRRRQVSIRQHGEMLGTLSRQFDYNRRTLLQSVARVANTVVNSYDRQAEAQELSENLRGAVTQTAIAGAGGIGLGAALVAFLGTAAADVSGVLAGMAILGLGLYIIPARRKRAKQDFENKMEELRTRLRRSMSEQFQKELNNSILRVQEAIAPYTRFVRAEQKKTATTQEQLQHLHHDLLALKNEIESMQQG